MWDGGRGTSRRHFSGFGELFSCDILKYDGMNASSLSRLWDCPGPLKFCVDLHQSLFKLVVQGTTFCISHTLWVCWYRARQMSSSIRKWFSVFIYFSTLAEIAATFFLHYLEIWYSNGIWFLNYFLWRFWASSEHLYIYSQLFQKLLLTHALMDFLETWKKWSWKSPAACSECLVQGTTWTLWSILWNCTKCFSGAIQWWWSVIITLD